jgi:hypothetical protein
VGLKAAMRPAAVEVAWAPAVQHRLMAAALTANVIECTSFLFSNIVNSSRRNLTTRVVRTD